MTSLPAMRAWRKLVLVGLACLSVGCSREKRRPTCDDLASCRALCDGGQTQACGPYASRLRAVASTRVDVELSTSVATRACDAGVASACSALADWVPSARKEEAETRQRHATLRYDAECKEGWVESCGHLAWQLRQGIGIAKDEARAAELEPRVAASYRKGCDRRVLADCLALASSLRDTGDEAVAVVDKACSLGSANACVRAAFEHKADARVGSWLERACGLSYALGCEMLAERGGVPGYGAAERALALRVAACDRGSWSDCDSAERVYAQRKSVPADLERARQIKTRMWRHHVARCEAGLARDCLVAGLAQRSSLEGGTLDARRAQALFGRGCELGDENACDQRKKLVEGFTAIAMAHFHGCGLGPEGEVRCWGVNSSGELGDGTTQGTLRKAVIAQLPRAKSVALTTSATCVVDAAGAVACVGRPFFFGVGVPSPQPSRITIGPVASMAMGARHGCLLERGGRVQCLGSQLLTGAVGDGTRDDATEPRPVKGLPARVDAIFAGAGTSCAGAGEKVFCWGNPPEVPAHDRLAPTEARRVAALDGAKTLAIGAFGTCAVFVTGKVGCLARPVHPLKRRELPVGTPNIEEVPGISDALEVTVGRAHACALVRGGAVHCWGESREGQLGGAVTSPARIEGLEATTLVTAQDRTCALENGHRGPLLLGGTSRCCPGPGAGRVISTGHSELLLSCGLGHGCGGDGHQGGRS